MTFGWVYRGLNTRKLQTIHRCLHWVPLRTRCLVSRSVNQICYHIVRGVYSWFQVFGTMWHRDVRSEKGLATYLVKALIIQLAVLFSSCQWKLILVGGCEDRVIEWKEQKCWATYNVFRLLLSMYVHKNSIWNGCYPSTVITNEHRIIRLTSPYTL